jgi:uncharacterized protein (DUF342 family)
MALFGNKDKQEGNAPKLVRSVVVRTENVAKELMSVASGNDVNVASLDFNILDVQTYTRLAENDKDTEWEELSSDEVAQITHGDMLLNPKFQIKQAYEIEIFSITEKNPCESFTIAVGANANISKVYLTVKPGAELHYFEGMEAALIKLLNKKKLRANLLINMFDDKMYPVVSDMVARARVNETLSFDEKEMHLIGEGIEPVATINDKMILHYDSKKQNSDEHGRVDHSKRGFIVSVVENELLMEYIKPKKGEPGRNCRGEYLEPPEPLEEHAPDFTISDKIEQIETDDKIEYRAKQSGYITFEGNAYDINTEMEVSEISFKTTGSIDSSLDADVSISVKETDVMKDAIGMGMEVAVNEINIEGNVGANARLHANKASVEGQVHQSAEVIANDLKINIHKGKARGKKVHITRLEHGTVEAEVVTIAQATGGKIMAKEIHIEILGSHVTMTATDKIEVEQLKGSENHFIIDPVMLSGNNEALEENEEKLKEAKRQIIDLEKEIEKYAKAVKNNEKAFIDLKKRLLHYKKNGVQMPSSFVKKYKEFQQMQTHLTRLQEELTQKNEYFELLAGKHHAFQSNIFDARVICHDKWQGHNTISFKLIEPEIEVMLVPIEGTHEEIFALYQDEETEEFSIVSVSE